MVNLMRAGQVHVFYRARIPVPEFAVGEESLDVRLFDEHEIPWDELAFPVVKLTLERYYKDTRSSHFPVHVENIIRHPARKG